MAQILAVNFHYFREEVYPSGIYPINRKTLLGQVDELAKTYTFISQNELVGMLRNRPTTDEKYCLITWDDGLKEQMEAFETLNSVGVPSVYYVPVKPFTDQTVLEVHKLHYARTLLEDGDIYEVLAKNYAIKDFAFDDEALKNQYRYDGPLARKVKYFLNFVLTDIERSEAIDRLFREVASDEAAHSRSLYMDISDLKKLASANSLGSHGLSHLALAPLEPNHAAVEIKESLIWLEETVETNMISFSYPFGGSTAVSTDLAEHFEGTNVEFALTMKRGLNGMTEMKNPLFLNRIDTNDAPGGKNYQKSSGF